MPLLAKTAEVHLIRSNIVSSTPKMKTRVFLFALFTAAFFSSVLRAAPSPELSPGTLSRAKRILILGDSITYAGGYVDFIEAAVRLNSPGWHSTFLDLGLSSETVSGLSEPDHAGGKFPRPDLHERLDRVLAQVQPDLVLACYGMNDGIYYPFAEERFAKFKEGIGWLREKVSAAHAQLIHLTPPVFDPFPIREKVLPDGLAAYPKAYEGYNSVLDRYSTWLLEQRKNGWKVIDVHGPMAAELALRRKETANFAFSKDGIHPDRLGHAIMARAILSGLKFSEALANAPVKWANEPETGFLRLIHTRRKLLSDAWLTATGHKRPGMEKGLPLPEATAKAKALEIEIEAAARSVR